MPLAVVTGASRGLGRAIAESLVRDGWAVVITGRDPSALSEAAAQLGQPAAGGDRVVSISGDVADPAHRLELQSRVRQLGPLDLLINNASELGPSPLPRLEAYQLDALERVYRVNVMAPVAIVQLLLPLLADHAAIVNVTSDASVEAYEGWGGYGSSKAALDHVTAVFAVEHPEHGWYAFDPGDMRTAMHQAAFPDEDISDRPEPATVVPALRNLLHQRPASGRYRAADLLRVGAPA